MGLSQFRGGAKKYESEDEDEDDMEGGNIANIIRGAVGSVGRTVGSFVPRLGSLGRSSRVAPTSTALVPLGSAGRPIAKPSFDRSWYVNALNNASSRALAVRGATATRGRTLTPAAIAQAIAMGIPLAMIGAYASNQSNQPGQEDGGYYDEYTGQEFGPGGPTDPTGGPSMGGPIDDGVASGGVPSDMNADELAWYLQTGNLPARYSARASRSKRGKGKLTITHGDEMNGGRMMSIEEVLARLPPRKGLVPRLVERYPYDPNAVYTPESKPRPPVSEKPYIPRVYEPPPKRSLPVRAPPNDRRSDRAEIVRQVMRQRGVSLPQASSIVKNEGLY
jgi:hypothetical protein